MSGYYEDKIMELQERYASTRLMTKTVYVCLILSDPIKDAKLPALNWLKHRAHAAELCLELDQQVRRTKVSGSVMKDLGWFSR